MKRKYYLRGIGVGILFATLVLMTAYQIFGGKTMSDEAVIKRAEELGMVPGTSALEQLEKPADTSATENTANTSATGTDTTDENQAQATTEATTEVASTEGTTEETTEGTTQAQTDKTVTITIVSGMNSWNVATILRDQGVITDALDFDSYLEQQGYSAKIATGEYEIPMDADYEAIAKIITGR